METTFSYCETANSIYGVSETERDPAFAFAVFWNSLEYPEISSFFPQRQIRNRKSSQPDWLDHLEISAKMADKNLRAASARLVLETAAASAVMAGRRHAYLDAVRLIVEVVDSLLDVIVDF